MKPFGHYKISYTLEIFWGNLTLRYTLMTRQQMLKQVAWHHPLQSAVPPTDIVVHTVIVYIRRIKHAKYRQTTINVM